MSRGRGVSGRKSRVKGPVLKDNRASSNPAKPNVANADEAKIMTEQFREQNDNDLDLECSAVYRHAPASGEEYPRCPTPPSPPDDSHSSANESVGDNFVSFRNNKVTQNSEKGLIILRSGRAKRFSYEDMDAKQYHEDPLQVNYIEDTDDSDYSMPDNNMPRFESTIQQIIDDAAVSERLLLESDRRGIAFSYLRFQYMLRARWYLVRLTRIEKLLGAQTCEDVPKEWKDIDAEFTNIYGPMDRDNDTYKMLRCRFRIQRINLYINVLTQENDLLRRMCESRVIPSECSSIITELRSARTSLEASLRELSEANVDLNPYTSPYQMDFFVLPRPLFSVNIYSVRPFEVDQLVEFSLDNDIFVKDGYNAAVYDVGCTFASKVVGDYGSRLPYFEGETNIPRRSYKVWYETLLELREDLIKYPLGVECSVFCTEFRKRLGMFDDELLFGKYSDAEGVFHLKDVFFPQKLGKDQRVILFHSLFEGMIITPEEILLRTWKRIRFLLEQEESQYLKLDDFQTVYESFYKQPLHVLKWGFENCKEFVEYCCDLFPETLSSVRLMDSDELDVISDSKAAKEIDAEEGWKENLYAETTTNDINPYEFHLSQEWFHLDDPLPSNYVLELPFPYPFGFNEKN